MPHSWIDHPGKVAVIGSIVILVGQLGATLFPMIFGPDLSDYNLVGDPIYIEIMPPSTTQHVFSEYHTGWVENGSLIEGMSLDVPFPKLPNTEDIKSIYIKNITGYKINFFDDIPFQEFQTKIYLSNVHPIHKYNRQVFLTVTCAPAFYANVSNPIVTIDQPSILYIGFNYTDYRKYYNSLPWEINETFPITIQGLGADGKERRCTIIMELKRQYIEYEGIPEEWFQFRK
jgi:hypothetical protein